MTLFKTKAARIAGYVAFGTATFFLSLYLTFPGQAVGQRISYEVEKASAGAVTADVSRASLSFPLGVSARDVRVRVPREEGDDIQIVFDEASGGLDLLSLLGFSVRPRGTVKLGEGTISAAFSTGATREIDATVSDLDLMKPPVVPTFAGLPVSGSLNASSSLSMDNDPKNSSGTIELTLEKASVGPGEVAGFSLPEPLGLGRIDIKLAIEDGELKIKEYQQSPEAQVRLELSGGMTLNRRFMSSAMNSCVKFRFNDEELLKRLPKLETAVQLAGARFKKDSEEFLNIPLRGTLTRPRGGSGIRAGKGLCVDNTKRRGPKR